MKIVSGSETCNVSKLFIEQRMSSREIICINPTWCVSVQCSQCMNFKHSAMLCPEEIYNFVICLNESKYLQAAQRKTIKFCILNVSVVTSHCIVKMSSLQMLISILCGRYVSKNITRPHTTSYFSMENGKIPSKAIRTLASPPVIHHQLSQWHSNVYK